MGWLRLVDFLKLKVFFAKEPYKRDDILQKRPSLLIVATPFLFEGKQLEYTHHLFKGRGCSQVAGVVAGLLCVYSSCRSLSAQEPLIIGLFRRKWPIKIRHPMDLRHPVHLHFKEWVLPLPLCVCVCVCVCLGAHTKTIKITQTTMVQYWMSEGGVVTNTQKKQGYKFT